MSREATGAVGVRVVPDPADRAGRCHGDAGRRHWRRAPNAIDRLIEGPQWDALSGRHGLVFWFNVVANQRHEVNRLATQLLLATSGWSADDVPLLRGPVLVAAKLPSGAPTALSMAHFELLNAWSTLSWRARRTLRHRIAAGN